MRPDARRQTALKPSAHSSPAPRPATRQPQAASGHTWLVALALAALTVANFAAVRRFDFVRFDDPDYVTHNPEVTAGLTWSGLRWAMTSAHAANWHPLTWLSHMLDVQLFGVNAGPHHMVNLLLHTINGVLLFAVLHAATRGEALGRSAFVAALFAVHPLHAESVAWVSERKDVLSTCCWMLAMLAYIRYARRPSLPRYAAVFVAFTLGLMAKPMVVTLPFVLLLLDYWPLGRVTFRSEGGAVRAGAERTTAPRLLLEKMPLVALAAASSVVTIVVQRRGGAVGALAAYPLALRFENAALNYLAYIGQMIWPARLSAFYPYRESVNPGTVVGAILLLAVITIAILRSSIRRPYLLVGWFWYLGTLLPVIGVVQVGMQSMADRYTYVPLIGLFIIVAWGGADLIARFTRRRAMAPVVAGVLVGACSARTRAQLGTWRNSLTLWQHAVDATSDNAYAQYNLGVVLVQSGRLDDGIERFREAIRIDPNYADVRLDLANALVQRGAVDEALSELATVVRLRPGQANARVAYGSLLRVRGRSADAVSQLREALRLDPNLGSAHDELGKVLTNQGRDADAMGEYSLAVQLDPASADAHNDLGAALARTGRYERALAEFLDALRLQPNAVMFNFNAALMFERLGRTEDAAEHLQAVLRVDPRNEAARQALNRVTAGKGGA